MSKIYTLEYDLTLINVGELEVLFNKFEINPNATYLVSKDVMPRDTRPLNDLKISEEVSLKEVGLSGAAWQFTSYEEDRKFTVITMRANPFANGLLANISQGTRGAGYCSYITVTTSDSKFAEAFKTLIRNSECKEIFSEK